MRAQTMSWDVLIHTIRNHAPEPQFHGREASSCLPGSSTIVSDVARKKRILARF
jgi:hypothetical protein